MSNSKKTRTTLQVPIPKVEDPKQDRYNRDLQKWLKTFIEGLSKQEYGVTVQDDTDFNVTVATTLQFDNTGLTDNDDGTVVIDILGQIENPSTGEQAFPNNKVGVDGAASPGFLGNAFNDGVLRTSTPLTYTDGGNSITLGIAQSSTSTDGFLNNIDWDIFNDKADYSFGSNNFSGTGDFFTTGDITGTILTSSQPNIDHDSLNNFVTNEHIDHTTVSVIAGTALTGGGTIDSNLTLNVDIDELSSSFNHNALNSLQGGNSSNDEFYHLDLEDVEYLADLTNNLIFTDDGDTLIGHWKMNDNPSDTVVIDSSNQNNDGSSSATTNLLTDDGKINLALNMDNSGGNHFVTIPHNTVYNFFDGNGDLPFTIAVWGFVSSSDSVQYLVSKLKTHSDGEWYVSIGSNESVRFVITDELANKQLTVITDDAITDGWHHIIATYDGSTTVAGMNIYVDNVLVDQTKDDSEEGDYNGMGTGSADRNVMLGNIDVGNTTNSWKERIDDVRIYNKEISETKRNFIYNLVSGTEETLNIFNFNGDIISDNFYGDIRTVSQPFIDHNTLDNLEAVNLSIGEYYHVSKQNTIDLITLSDDSDADALHTHTITNLTDTLLTSIANNDIFKYNNSDGRWKNFSDPATATNEPTGFINRTDSVLSFNTNPSDAMTFTIEPSVDKYVIWQQGTKYTITNTHDVIIPDVNGVHFIYFDDEILTLFSNPSHVQTDTIIIDKVLVGLVYLNALENEAPIVADERHGCNMSGNTHEYLHDTVGAKYKTGLTVSDYVLDTDSDIALTFELADGEFYDEDILVEIGNGDASNQYEQVLNGADAIIPILYREGVNGPWKEDAATTLPYKSFGAGRLAFNSDLGGGVWGQTEITDNKYVSMTLIATNDWEFPIKAIQGQIEYLSKQTAIEEANAEVVAFGDFPSPEIIILYRLVLNTKNTFGGEKKTKIVDITDFRTSGITGAITLASDHGSLSGLADDDHGQYLLIDGTRAMTGSLVMSSNEIQEITSLSGDTLDVSGQTQVNIDVNNNIITWDGSDFFPSASENLGTVAKPWGDLKLSGAATVLGIGTFGSIISNGDMDLTNNNLLNPGTGHDVFTDYVDTEHLDHALNLDNNLIVWIRGDDEPSSGNPVDAGNAGNIWSAEGDVVRANGIIGNGWLFDGTGDYLSNTTLIDIPTGTDPRTFSLWMKCTSNRAEVFYSQGESGAGDGWEMQVRGDGNGRFLIAVGAGNMQGTIALNDGVWHHIAVAGDGSNIDQFLMYIDGVLDSGATHGEEPLSTLLTPTSIGGNSVFGNVEFTGLLDDFRIYDRELSGDEILELYRIGTLEAMTSFDVGYFTEYIASRSGYLHNLNSINGGITNLTTNILSGFNGTVNSQAILSLTLPLSTDNYIDFIGSSDASYDSNLSNINGDSDPTGPKLGSSQDGWIFDSTIKIKVNGCDRWIAVYSCCPAI